MGSLALRPATSRFGNSRPRVTTTPLPHATKAHGQFLGRDFNPLDSLLLLRTVRLGILHYLCNIPSLTLMALLGSGVREGALVSVLTQRVR